MAARVPLLVLGGSNLLLGLIGALLLLGLPAPVTTERLPQVHGPALVLGFVGTLIALERAVALRRGWAFAAPALLGTGTLIALHPAGAGTGPLLVLAGAVGLVGCYAALWQRQPSDALALQVLGAVAAVAAALLWVMGAPVPAALPWYAAFVVLTIAGERVELSRLTIAPGRDRTAFPVAASVLVGVVATAAVPGGHVLLGVALLVLVAWLLRYDVARRTAGATGLPRYVAWCLLAGYAWLALAGATWALAGAVTAGPAYDALVHAVFLGFTLTMIMAHAPVILPAVLHIRLPYHRLMWAPVALLQGSLLLRVVGGDLHGAPWALQVGGALNIAAVLGFVLVAAGSAAGARLRRDPPREAAGVETPTTAPQEVSA